MFLNISDCWTCFSPPNPPPSPSPGEDRGALYPQRVITTTLAEFWRRLGQAWHETVTSRRGMPNSPDSCKNFLKNFFRTHYFKSCLFHSWRIFDLKSKNRNSGITVLKWATYLFNYEYKWPFMTLSYSWIQKTSKLLMLTCKFHETYRFYLQNI